MLLFLLRLWFLCGACFLAVRDGVGMQIERLSDKYIYLFRDFEAILSILGSDSQFETLRDLSDRAFNYTKLGLKGI